MTQALGPLAPLAPLLYGLILISLGIGLPIIVVLTIRFLWSGHLRVGRSRELDKLVWQLHRIASSLEQESAQSAAVDQAAPARSAASAVSQQPAASAHIATAPVAPTPVAQAPATATPTAPSPTSQAPPSPSPAARPPIGPKAPGKEEPPRAGVNSMFGF